MIGGGTPAPPPPAALTQVTFTSYLGRTFTVALVLDAFRDYFAAVPRVGGSESMVAVRYVDDHGFLPDPFCVVYARRSLGVRGALDAMARAGVRYYGTKGGGGEEMRGPVPPAAPSGISWPLSERALYYMAHGDYLGFRLRGAAGFVRPILPAHYATADFWVEPNGVAAGPSLPPV